MEAQGFLPFGTELEQLGTRAYKKYERKMGMSQRGRKHVKNYGSVTTGRSASQKKQLFDWIDTRCSKCGETGHLNR